MLCAVRCVCACARMRSMRDEAVDVNTGRKHARKDEGAVAQVAEE